MELFVPSLKYKTILVILDANLSIFGEIPHENIKLLNKLFKNIRNPSNDLLDSYEDKDHENLLILYYLKKCETMTLNQIINNRNSEHYLWANLHQTRINNRESELIRELDSNPNSFFKSYIVNNAFEVKTDKDKYFRYQYNIGSGDGKICIMYNICIIETATNPVFCVITFKKKFIIVNWENLPQLFTRNNPWLCYTPISITLYYKHITPANELMYTSELFNGKLIKKEYHIEILNGKFLNTAF